MYIRCLPKVAGPYRTHPTHGDAPAELAHQVQRWLRASTPLERGPRPCRNQPQPVQSSLGSSALHVSGSPGEKLEQGPARPAVLHSPVLDECLSSTSSRLPPEFMELPLASEWYAAQGRSGSTSDPAWETHFLFGPSSSLNLRLLPRHLERWTQIKFIQARPEGIDIGTPGITWHWQSRPALGILWPIDPCRHPFSSARRHLRGPHRAGFPQQGPSGDVREHWTRGNGHVQLVAARTVPSCSNIRPHDCVVLQAQAGQHSDEGEKERTAWRPDTSGRSTSISLVTAIALPPGPEPHGRSPCRPLPITASPFFCNLKQKAVYQKAHFLQSAIPHLRPHLISPPQQVIPGEWALKTG
jgi:hypothetical protein